MNDAAGPRVRVVRAPAPREPQRDGRVVTTIVVVVGLVMLLGAMILLQGLSTRLHGGAVAAVLTGSTLEIAAENGWAPLAPGAELADGARLRTGGDQARLRLRDGEVWLGPGTAARVLSHRVDLVRGEAVVRSGGLLGARWTDVDVAGAGTFRVTPGTNPRVAVYHGEAEVRRPAESRALRALEQLGLAGRRLPGHPDPLDYRADDPWDAELLGQAIAFDDEVERIGRGIDLRFTRAPRPLDFYRGFSAVNETTLPVLRTAAREALADGRFGPPSDVLVTLFVAEAAARVDDTPLSDLTAQISRRRADGARWGLVAMERDLTAQDFNRSVDLSRIDQVAGLPLLVPLPAPPVVPLAELFGVLTPLSPDLPESAAPFGPFAPGVQPPGPSGANAPGSDQGSGEPAGQGSTPAPREPGTGLPLPPPGSDPPEILREAPAPALPRPNEGPVGNAPAPEVREAIEDQPITGTLDRGAGLVRGTVDQLLDTALGFLGGRGR